MSMNLNIEWNRFSLDENRISFVDSYRRSTFKMSMNLLGKYTKPNPANIRPPISRHRI